MRFTVSAFLILAFFFTSGQTCSISADSVACKNELIAFSAQTSSGASSYSWDFGDGTTSNVQNIAKSYSTPGKKIISLEVTFSGGGTCTVTDSVMIHDLPVPSFSFTGSTYCFSEHEICLTDNSTMGSTTSGYDQRIILWGDGASTSSSSPSAGNKICYEDYSDPDVYHIVVEVTNDEGCEAIWQADVEVLREFIPSFTPSVENAGCTYQTVCLSNDSAKPSDIERFIWNFGDGEVDSTRWARPCHPFPESKTYTATLSVELDNGCTAISSRNFTTAFQEVTPDPKVSDTGMCYPQEFLCYNAPVFFSSYYWYLIDTNGDTVDNASGQISSLEPPVPGTYFVAARMKLGDCDTSSPWIQVESLGIKADFLSLNHDQCASMDTVYFVNTSIMHPTAVPDYLWKFYDTLSPSTSSQCSTALNNCNFDTTGVNSKHLYEVQDCYYPTVVAYDITTGCIDSFVDTISRISQEYILFEASEGRRCLGGKEEYGIGFTHNLCGGGVYFNPDTACFSNYVKFEGGWLYGSLCDPDNWVSPSFIVVQGDNKVYRSADTTDFYIDNNQICVDTVTYHHMFKLYPEPNGSLVLQKNQCLPVDAEWVYTGTDDSSFAVIRYNWSDPVKVDEIVLDEKDFPEIKHTYTKAGDYAVFIYVEDTNGCFLSRGMGFPPLIIAAGYFNTFTVDSVICPNVEFQARDSILYWFDGVHYWRDTMNPEIVSWDFGDGNGFATTGPLPFHTYTDKGIYTIRMATIDRNGCKDTFSREVIVGGVNAVIKNVQTEYLCDQIVQFFDSSWSNLTGPTDIINSYYWDFGDGTNKSKLKNPFHFYDQNGYFTLTHAVSNAKGCSDTVRIQIYMRGPEPYFDIITDTVGCAPFTAGFALSGANISEFVLHLGDPLNSSVSSEKDTVIYFKYTQPGVYDIFLAGTDSFYNPVSGNYYSCTEFFPDSTQEVWPRRQIVVLPTPTADFTYDKPVCPGIPVQFRNSSDTIYKQFTWALDSNILPDDDDELEYTFTDTGSYLISLYPSYDPPPPYFVTCYDTVSKWVDVSYVRAGFLFDQVDNCSGFQFSDSSDRAVSYSWDFGHPVSGSENFSEEMNPQHSYSPDTGTFRVCLTVENEEGCVDEYCENIISAYRVFASFVNVFTPDGDKLNDNFAPEVDGEDIYELEIYNRWGEIVFTSNSKDIMWDGTDYKTGTPLPASTYFYVLKYRFECTGEEHEVHGMVELIR